jgi:hypothetical protein
MGLGMTARDAEQRPLDYSPRTRGSLDGLIVPLARTCGINLVLCADRLDVGAAFEVVGREENR